MQSLRLYHGRSVHPHWLNAWSSATPGAATVSSVATFQIHTLLKTSLASPNCMDAPVILTVVDGTSTDNMRSVKSNSSRDSRAQEVPGPGSASVSLPIDSVHPAGPKRRNHSGSR